MLRNVRLKSCRIRWRPKVLATIPTGPSRPAGDHRWHGWETLGPTEVRQQRIRHARQRQEELLAALAWRITPIGWCNKRRGVPALSCSRHAVARRQNA